MGQLKQKLVHAAMPHTWLIYMLKPIKGNRHSTCEKRSSQSKKSATLQNKHTSGSIDLNHKGSDIHFSSTLKKSSLKACRGGPSRKQAYKQENLQSSKYDFDTEPGRLRRLYRCTMSPTSRKLCAGIEVAEMHANAHDHLIMPPTHAPHGDPSHTHIASKKRNFKLNIEELEMKLNALRSEERWRNTYISPSLSVAVPSPFVDGALDYSSYPQLNSLETPLQPPLRGGEGRSTAAKRNSGGISQSTLKYCSSGTDTKHSFLSGGDCFTTMEEHQARDFPTGRHMGYSKGSAKEARSKPQLRIGRLELHDIHRNHGRRSCMTSLQRKASKMNSPKQSVLQFNASPNHNDYDDGCLEFRSKLFRSLSTRSVDSTPSSIATTSSLDETCFKSSQMIPSISEISRPRSVDATPSRYCHTLLLAENVDDLVNNGELVHPKKGLDSSQENIGSLYELESKPTRPFNTAAAVHHYISCAGKSNHPHRPHTQLKKPSIWGNATRRPACAGAIGVHDNYGELDDMQCQSYRSMKSPRGSAPIQII